MSKRASLVLHHCLLSARVIYQEVPPPTLPALNDANILILRHLKQEELEVDADLTLLRRKGWNGASVTDFDQPVTLMFTGLRVTSWPIMQRRRGMDLTAFIPLSKL